MSDTKENQETVNYVEGSVFHIMELMDKQLNGTMTKEENNKYINYVNDMNEATKKLKEMIESGKLYNILRDACESRQ